MADTWGHRDSSSSERSRTRSCGNVTLKLRGIAGDHRDRLAECFDQGGVVGGVDAVGGRVAVGTAQQIGSECLWRLRRDQRRAVEGGRDAAVAHLLHSVHAGYPGSRRSFSTRRVEHGSEQPGRRRAGVRRHARRSSHGRRTDPVPRRRCPGGARRPRGARPAAAACSVARSRIACHLAAGAATTMRSKQPAAAIASSVTAKTGRPPASAQSLSSPVRTPRPKAGTMSALLSAERPWRASASPPAA